MPIVRKIRCEARDFIIGRAAGLIQFSAANPEYSSRDIAAGEAEIAKGELDLAKSIRENPASARSFGPWDVDPLVYVQFGPFMNSTIDYSFTLTISENNVVGVDPNLNATGGSHSVKLNVADHKLDATRKNQRTFEVKDSGLDSYQRLRCPRDVRPLAAIPVRDFAYPMRGQIGFDKTFSAYEHLLFANTDLRLRTEWARKAAISGYKSALGLESAYLNDIKNLRRLARTCPSLSSDVCNAHRACYRSVMESAFLAYGNYFYSPPSGLLHFGPAPGKDKLSLTDDLTFTTRVDGGLSPAITFSDAVGSLKVNALGFKLTGYRKDIHRVAINLVAPPPISKPKATRDKPLASRGDYQLFVRVPDDGKKATRSKPTKNCAYTSAVLHPPMIIQKAPVDPGQDQKTVRAAPPPAAPPRVFADPQQQGFLSSSELEPEQLQSIEETIERGKQERRLIEIDDRLRSLTE